MSNDPKEAESTSPPNPEIHKLSIGELIARLNVGQVWGVVGILVGLISGAFVLGYKANGAIVSASLNKMSISLNGTESELKVAQADAEQKSQELEKYRKKDRFMSLFLRYEQAQNKDHFTDARDALDDYVLKFLDQSEKEESFIRFGKGRAKLTTVRFWDGSEWTIPPDSRAATED